MPGFVDLHIHSRFSSDGDFAPAELIAMAREAGFAAISISDHDTTAAYPEAVEAAVGTGVEIVPSMEVTTLFEGREFHLLLPYLDWTSPVIARIAERVSAGRLIEARERVARLGELGLDLSWEDVEAASPGAPPLGVAIAQILLDKPSSKNVPALRKYFEGPARTWAPYHFYRDYFMDGRPASVVKRHMPLLEVLDAAPGSGAVPVLAHPGAYFENATRGDLAALKDKGLAGLEVYTSYHTPELTAFYRGLAAELDLVPTAGSDFHGRIKPHVRFGDIRDGGPEILEQLRVRRRQA
jgi:predicted metal-dependent phosphoesterase TrpH